MILNHRNWIKICKEIKNFNHIRADQISNILDVGCGTGTLAEKISQFDCSVTGVDNSPSMIKEAQEKISSLTFTVEDARDLSSYAGQFDAVFSNATLHWIKEMDQVIRSVWNALKPNGRFIAEMGGQYNIQAIVDGINYALDKFNFSDNKRFNPWVFPSVAEYTSILEKQGFTVREVYYYDRPTKLEDGNNGLRNWVNMFASFFFEGVPEGTYKLMLNEIEAHAKSKLLKDNIWYADYKRLRLKAVKA